MNAVAEIEEKDTFRVLALLDDLSIPSILKDQHLSLGARLELLRARVVNKDTEIAESQAEAAKLKDLWEQESHARALLVDQYNDLIVHHRDLRARANMLKGKFAQSDKLWEDACADLQGL